MIWAADVSPAAPPAGIAGPGVVGLLPAGAGIGWRPEIAGVVADLPDLAFCEVIAEAVDPASPPRAVAELRARGVAVVPHGVRLSLGSAEAVEADRVTHLAATAAALGAPLVSEHVAFVRSRGREAGHLLQVPRTRAALDALAANVARLQAELDVPLALEPIASLLDWPEDEYTEAEFLAALLDRTGARLLLDVANVHANAVNRGRDPEAVLDTLPLDRVAYVHVAGGAVRPDGLYHDTHTHPVPGPVLALLRSLRERLPADPPVLLERDGAFPAAGQLRAEFAEIVEAAAPAGAAPVRPPAGGRPSGEVPARAGVSLAAVPVGARSDRATLAGASLAPVPVGASSDRATLAAAQARLLDALVAGAPDPPGFDPHRLDATRAALLRKRAGEVARAWPSLAASLGERWPAAFAAHATGRSPKGALRDGWDLARALRAANALGPGAAAELTEHEATFRYDGVHPPRRRSRLSRALRRR